MPRTTTRPSIRPSRAPAGLVAAVTLVLLLSGLPAAPAQAYRADLGELTKRSQVLRQGCHAYPFRYSVDPPPGDWVLEVFVIHRRSGRVVTHVPVAGGWEPKSGRRTFRLCRPSTRPGRYKLTGKLSVQNGYEYGEWWVKPGYFRFYRR